MENEVEFKKQFAHNLLLHDDPQKAAFATLTNPGHALFIAVNWVNDPVVKAEVEALMQSKGAKKFLPSKERQAKDVYAIACDTGKGTEERLKAHRLYAEIMGFIEKPNVGNTTNVLNNGVMVVRDLGTDDDWANKALVQQHKLIDHGATRVN